MLRASDAGKQNCARRIQARPSEQRQEAAKQDENSVMPRESCGHSIRRVFALARAQNPGNGECGEASDGLDCGGAANVEETVAEPIIHAKLR